MGRRPSLGVEVLEHREMPAATAMLVGATLTVNGGPDRDRIEIVRDRFTGVLSVLDAGQLVNQFAQAAVTGININGGAGDDVLGISPDIALPATLNGGLGDDRLFAGFGNTTLLGGGGNDKLVADGKISTMQGGAGRDLIIGGPAVDTVDGQADADLIQRVTVGDVIAADPLDQVRLEPAIAVPVVVPETPLAAGEVNSLLQRAAAASGSNDAIIAIVDRHGRILGIRVEDGVDPAITGDIDRLVFAIDGAVAKARTAAFFANDQAPLTSRTVRFISQSTITQREVESMPSITDPNSPLRGPGFVAPIGIGNHFPPGVMFTPQVDLFQIEHTNRDSIRHAGADRIKGTGDDVDLPYRFNINPAFVPAGQEIFAPESYGRVSGLRPNAQSRGIATLPGGIPLYKKDAANVPRLVGGIGVFFPGGTGFATAENPGDSQGRNPNNPDRSVEAEAIAAVTAAGLPIAGAPNVPTIGVIGLTNGFNIPGAKPTTDGSPPRIDLVGITLDVVGPGGIDGLAKLLALVPGYGTGNPNSGAARGLPLDSGFVAGLPVPSGFLVTPHDGVNLRAADVERIIVQAVEEANKVRAAIRLPLDERTKMVLAVTDSTGEVLGLYRMPDATYFSIDVAVAKARNVTYYADSTKLQAVDNPQNTPPGAAFTNRTFRYLSLPRFPEGIDGSPPGPFSQLNSPGIDTRTGLNLGGALAANSYDGTVVGFDAFHPGTNFKETGNILNQNGIVFFPGSAPLYRDVLMAGLPLLVGGFGVSGDGVDQDDVVTFFGAQGYGVPNGVLRADQVFFNGVRLPYQKFNRGAEG